jgi:hypothetical protein
MIFAQVIAELTHKQIKEIMLESFGPRNAIYHTLDEVPFQKLINKIPKTICPICGKEFIPNIEGFKEINNKIIDLNCYWNNDEEKLDQLLNI